MSSPLSKSDTGPGQTEFVILISVTMMIVAFAIDSMLPALPAIGASLRVPTENDQQLVVSSFLLGFGIAQLFVGTLSDRYGRRGLILWSLVGFALTSLAATLAHSFEMLLAARVTQGIFCAGARVIVTSIVRDRFEGRAMAQVMSLSSMIFMAAPILAPTMGQLVLEVGPWRWIFAVLALIGVTIWAWVFIRLPETLRPENRTEISVTNVIASAKQVAMDRLSLGYSLAMSAISCALFAFLLSVQQIFDHSFHRAEFLPTGFAIMAAGMAVASLLNASIVKRYGMRLIGHSALFFFTAVAGIHLVIAATGYETLVTFIALQMVMMMGFALVAGNFGAMAMENMGNVAGMASSLQGSLANIIGAIVGTVIGQSFDGTTVPLYAGYFLCGLIALVVVFVTEAGQFFVARNAPPAAIGE
jgi:MFS transporter, DHA1 family, multidrug resistance protein